MLNVPEPDSFNTKREMKTFRRFFRQPVEHASYLNRVASSNRPISQKTLYLISWRAAPFDRLECGTQKKCGKNNEEGCRRGWSFSQAPNDRQKHGGSTNQDAPEWKQDKMCYHNPSDQPSGEQRKGMRRK
jgi:hypothetical protein